MNKVILIGRLTSDPELQVTPSGINTVRFCVAVNRRFKNKQDGYDADFINCAAWRQQAEFICKYFKKGSMIGISGSLQTSSWDGTDGKRQYRTEVIIEEVDFCEKAREHSQYQSYQPSQEKNQSQQTTIDEFSVAGFSADENEDDLPF